MNDRSKEIIKEGTSDKKFGVYLIVSGLIAWIASGVLVLDRLALYKNPNHVTSCDINPWVSCGTVMKSWQAELFGFPNPLIGIVGFAIIIAIGFALLAGAKFAKWFWISLQVGITLALGFIVWLISQALYDIQVLCLYCMIVWAVVIPLFINTFSKILENRSILAPAGLVKVVREWKIPASIILVATVGALVVLKFPNAFF